MPTPLVYESELYVLNNNGILGCYDLKTGKEHYYDRIPHRSFGFSASPVGADGRIYLAGEDGLIFVIKAGKTLNHLATHAIGEPLMATPAISAGTLYIRGSRHLFAVGK